MIHHQQILGVRPPMMDTTEATFSVALAAVASEKSAALVILAAASVALLESVVSAVSRLAEGALAVLCLISRE